MKFSFTIFISLVFISTSLYAQPLTDIAWTGYTPADTITLLFNSNDTLYVTNSDTSFAISTFTSNQDTAWIRDLPNASLCSDTTVGVYGYSIINDTLTLDSLNDPCPDRVAILQNTTWFTMPMSLNEYETKPTVNLYPNPIHSQSVLRIDNSNSKATELKVYDLNGKLIRSYNDISSDEILISKGNMGLGIYYYQLLLSNGITCSGKFMVK